MQPLIPVQSTNMFERFKSDLPFVPQIKMLQPQTKTVMDGTYKEGTFLYNSAIDLGRRFPALCIKVQPCAIEFLKGKLVRKSNTMEIRTKVPNPDEVNLLDFEIIGDKDFVEISQSSDDRNRSHIFRWGAEVLLYLPVYNKFGTLFLGSESARRRIYQFEQWQGYPVEISSHMIENKDAQTRWAIPDCTVIPEEQIPAEMDTPPPALLQSMLAKFTPSAQLALPAPE